MTFLEAPRGCWKGHKLVRDDLADWEAQTNNLAQT